MDIWGALRTVGRRWYVSLIVLMLCLSATSTVVSQVEATYDSESTVILLPPSLRPAQNDEIDALTNPFLETGIANTAAAITSAANSDRVADLLRAAGLEDVEFEVENFGQSPVISIRTTSNSGPDTTAAIAIVVSALQDVTRQLQIEAQSPENQFISAQVLAPPPGAPVESLATKTKVAMGMVVASFLVVLCAALLADNIARRRRRRRVTVAHVAPQPTEATTESDGAPPVETRSRRRGRRAANDKDVTEGAGDGQDSGDRETPVPAPR